MRDNLLDKKTDGDDDEYYDQDDNDENGQFDYNSELDDEEEKRTTEKKEEVKSGGESGSTQATEGLKQLSVEKPVVLDEKKYREELERYDPENVADLMYARKERKIPGSVLKPHNS